jgi:hypothetical protein
MAIVSEAVANAEADIARLGPEIEEWTNNFLELLANVTKLDLIFQEAETMDLNYVALCQWDDPSNLVVVQSIPMKLTAEQRKRILATTSVLAAMLHKFGHDDVAVVLLGDDVGKMFRHEAIVGRSRAVPGCSRVSSPKATVDFSSIRGHREYGVPPAFN